MQLPILISIICCQFRALHPLTFIDYIKEALQALPHGSSSFLRCAMLFVVYHLSLYLVIQTLSYETGADRLSPAFLIAKYSFPQTRTSLRTENTNRTSTTMNTHNNQQHQSDSSFTTSLDPSPATTTTTTTTIINGFDIVQAAIDHLRTCDAAAPVNQSLRYDQVKAVFDAHPDYAGVCDALHDIREARAGDAGEEVGEVW